LVFVRFLVLSTLYPPGALGGYEVECSSVVERLAEQNEVLVVTSGHDHGVSVGEESSGPRVQTWRELALLSPDQSGALRAPLASLRAARTARRALAWKPDLIYAWNGASIPHAALRVLADSGVPLAFRVCEHWFGGLFRRDQFMRELLPEQRSATRTCWAAGCRAFNMLPPLRLDANAPVRAAISWNSQAIKRMVDTPPVIDAVLERVDHSVPRYGDLYAAAQREPTTRPDISFVGRITPVKGVDVAIEALALLRSEHQIAATLTLTGPEDSEYAADLRDRAAQLGVGDALRWQGPQQPQAVTATLARSSAMIVPSTWDEPFPLVTIEGALARVPLVASDVGGISEGMADEEHALLFARGDAAGAARALARTLGEREQTAARVQRAFEHAQRYRIGPYLDSQERFVHDALDAFAGGPSSG
jgi:glycosyltransferase involved in cell wall biosynthesis